MIAGWSYVVSTLTQLDRLDGEQAKAMYVVGREQEEKGDWRQRRVQRRAVRPKYPASRWMYKFGGSVYVAAG
ncbi:hypothetical protein RRF57_008913 [Xylaria bambusicola]|uniref:Uncharacterized protein n=1 Tax=Xylaria bambusicola TaxID=326684 RepID=A0AAN7V260_9PEZI